MGKNNRCKAKATRKKMQFEISPLEVAQAETHLDEMVKMRADAIAAQSIHDAGWIFALMHNYILCKTFRFSPKMLDRFMTERLELAKSASEEEAMRNYDLIEKMYNYVEETIGTELTLKWFAKLPEPEEA